MKVHFILEDLLVEAPDGASLQAVADAAGADITFGCRTGSCGTCRVRMAEGLDTCSPAGPEERAYLAALGAPADHRLACQVTLHGDAAVDYLGL